jgi:hypothetical protein
MSMVFKEWVVELPWRMQSVLMTATRGPDGPMRYPNIKVLNRWTRDKLFNDADPANPFIIHPDDPHPCELSVITELGKELEYTTVHYYSHVIHALEIIAYEHPEFPVQDSAYRLYYELGPVLMHMKPEQKHEHAARLGRTESESQHA